MPDLDPSLLVLAACVGAYTVSAAVWDIRFRRIPNALTVSSLVVGIVYQLTFHGLSGLGDAAAGFAIGFGPLFVLWMIGGGGAGDVKLLAALGIWLGFQQTAVVLVGSTALIALVTFGGAMLSMLRFGFRRTRRVYSAKGQNEAPRNNRQRLVPFAVPVAVTTWLMGAIVFWMA